MYDSQHFFVDFFALERAARDHVHQKERERRDDEQRQQGGQRPLDYKFCHIMPLF